jgi:hypothetical protein
VISIDVNDSSIVTGTIANNTINNLPGSASSAPSTKVPPAH